MKVIVTNVVIGLCVILFVLLFVRKIPNEDLNFKNFKRIAITEAVQLDLEYSNSMIPSINGTQLFEKHLTAIREEFPMVEGVEYCGKWAVSELIVTDFNEMYVDDCIALINGSEYGPVWLSPKITSYSLDVITFEMLFNPEKLAPIISKLCGVRASPNHIHCWDAEYMQLDFLSETLSKYTFSKGYGDCPSGCMYKHFWQFSIVLRQLYNEWEVGDKSLDGLY